MLNLTKRQLKILDFVRQNGGASNKEIKSRLKNVSRITIVRDLKDLVDKSLLEETGKGRNVRYREKTINSLSRYIDVNGYFKKGPDEREAVLEHFNFKILENLKNVFNAAELNELKMLNEKYQKRIKKMSAAEIKKEFERLTIELSWKSSKIEGNTYSLIDTEILIKEHKEAKGHKKEEAIMILNHKAALDYILSKPSEFRKINLRKTENIHDLIIKEMAVQRGLRKKPVGIVGTRYKPLDNIHQIRESMEKTLILINSLKDPFSKALLAILLISYIQPFEDGNKRTARLLGDALLLAHKACPLSFRSVNEADYKKALVIFYEQNNIRFFKELFVEQFKFAIKNYFQ